MLRDNLETNPRQKVPTRIRILDAAMHLFYEVGAHQTSFQMIADRVGISQPGIYKHFNNFEDLLGHAALLAAERGRDFVDQPVAKAKDPQKRFKAYIKANFDFALEHPHEGATMLSMYFYASSMDQLKLNYEKANKVACQRISQFVADCINPSRSGKAASMQKTKYENLASTIHSLISGEVIKALHFPGKESSSRRANRLWKLISIWIEEAN